MARPPILDDCVRDTVAQEYRHNPCGGTVLMTRTIHHSIHNSGIFLAGFGEVVTEYVPYCPTCDPGPNIRSDSLTINPNDEKDNRILARIRNSR